MKTVLSILPGGRSADLSAATALVEGGGAHLSVLALSVAPSPPVGEIASAAALTSIWYESRQEVEQANAKAVDACEQVVASAGIQADVIGSAVEMAALPGEVARRARYADIVLLGPDLLADPTMGTAVLDAVLFDSGTTALLVPPGATPTLSPARVMVAWNSTHEAARALKEACNTLRLPDALTVVMIDPEGSELGQGEEPGADVAAYLARKGHKVTVDRRPGMGQSTDVVLRQAATDLDAELIIMGAYGHSRLRQRIFGGVTRSLTREPPVPILMAR